MSMSAVMVAVGVRERDGGNRRRENNLENGDKGMPFLCYGSPNLAARSRHAETFGACSSSATGGQAGYD